MDLRHTLPISSRSSTLLAFVVQIPLMLASAPASALGLGNASVKTAIGYPLSVEIPILDRSAALGADQVRVRQVLGRNAEQMGYDLAADAKRFLITVSEQSGGLTIQVQSPTPLNEPFVSFALELSWPGGTLYRDYALLVDLPPTVPPATAAAPAQSASPAVQRSVQTDSTYTGTSSTSKPYSEKQWHVAPGESLWRIARRVQPDSSISLDAVMAAIHAHNPHAFLNGDINLLRAGALLDLPSAADYSASTATTGRPAAARPEPAVPAAHTPSPTNRVEETPQARLRLSGSPAENSGSHAMRISAELDAAKELLDKVNRENEQLRQQIQRIETSDYLAVMQEMLQLQEQRIKELESRVRTSANNNPEGISVAAPAPVIVRDTGPSYAELLLLALAGIASGVALSQLTGWWRKRRAAAESSPESQGFSFEPLTPDWGDETGVPSSLATDPDSPLSASHPSIFIFPPAPEPDAAEAEESGMASTGDEEAAENKIAAADTENAEESKIAAAGSEEVEEDKIAAVGDSNEAEESKITVADGEEDGQESLGSPAILAVDQLFEDLQFDEYFGEKPSDLPAQSSPSSNDYLVLDFAPYDQLPLDEIDPAPATVEDSDADAKNAISKAVV